MSGELRTFDQDVMLRRANCVVSGHDYALVVVNGAGETVAVLCSRCHQSQEGTDG